MPVNFANVNISLQQFQDIATGKYNAGEIRLTSATTLGKVNDHVHRRGANGVPLSHAEILAVKDAFVRALKQNGIGGEELNRIRQELGLAPAARRTPPSPRAASARSPARRCARSSTATWTRSPRTTRTSTSSPTRRTTSTTPSARTPASSSHATR